MVAHDYKDDASEYAELGFKGTYYLAFRDLPPILQRHGQGNDKKALDYGCGAGRSTRFLQSWGFETVGVDVSEPMLSQARSRDETGEYHLIRSGQIPYADASFDLVFSSFVFLEVPSLQEIKTILIEMKRVLKDNGIIIIITSPSEAYKGNWVSFSYDFPENERVIQSGDTVKVLVRGTGVIFSDYYWTEQDYAQLFLAVGLKTAEILTPLGKDEDPFEWLDEKHKASMLIYVLEKEARR